MRLTGSTRQAHMAEVVKIIVSAFHCVKLPLQAKGRAIKALAGWIVASLIMAAIGGGYYLSGEGEGEGEGEGMQAGMASIGQLAGHPVINLLLGAALIRQPLRKRIRSIKKRRPCGGDDFKLTTP